MAFPSVRLLVAGSCGASSMLSMATAALRAKPIVHDDLAASLDALVGEQGVVPRRGEVAALREPDANQLGLAPFDDVAYMRGSCFGSYQIADTQVANGALAAIGHEHEG